MRNGLGFSFKVLDFRNGLESLGFRVKSKALDVENTTLKAVHNLWESYGQNVILITFIVHKMCTKFTPAYPCKYRFMPRVLSHFFTHSLHTFEASFSTLILAINRVLCGYIHSFHKAYNNNKVNI